MKFHASSLAETIIPGFGDEPDQYAYTSLKYDGSFNVLAWVYLVQAAELLPADGGPPKPFVCEECKTLYGVANGSAMAKDGAVHLRSPVSFLCRDCGGEVKWTAASHTTRQRKSRFAV